MNDLDESGKSGNEKEVKINEQKLLQKIRIDHCPQEISIFFEIQGESQQ